MKLTAIIQAGEDGHVLVVATAMSSCQRDMLRWQRGSIDDLHIRAIYQGAPDDALSLVTAHHVRRGWHHPGALATIIDGLMFGRMPELETLFEQSHQESLSTEDARTQKAALMRRMRGNMGTIRDIIGGGA